MIKLHLLTATCRVPSRQYAELQHRGEASNVFWNRWLSIFWYLQIPPGGWVYEGVDLDRWADEFRQIYQLLVQLSGDYDEPDESQGRDEGPHDAGGEPNHWAGYLEWLRTPQF